MLCFLLLVAALAPAASGKSTITIAPGLEMPLVNLGGVTSEPSNYSSWLEVGGRGLDTALSYTDSVQTEVGKAINSSSVPRANIFLTSKVPCCPSSTGGRDLCANPELRGPMPGLIQKDLDMLGAPLDLLLLHWPCDTFDETLAAYQGMEDAYNKGLTRAIGVSNFNVSILAEILPHMKVKPVVNQCGHSIGAHNASHNAFIGGDDATVRFCVENNIAYSAYSPLGGLNGIDVFKDPTVIDIAAKHGVGPAQVALRWLVQQNISFVTSSSHPKYQQEDLDVFSFSLSELEMVTLAGL